MFEYGQDVAILHAAVLSAERALSSKKNFVNEDQNVNNLTKEDVKEVVHVITTAVQVIVEGADYVKWTSFDKYLANERIHATLLYNTLKSSGIVSKRADNYYEKVANFFPLINWTIYIELVKSCLWSQQYIRCMSELPDEVAAAALRITVDHCHGEFQDFKEYMLYSALQVLLSKLLLHKCKAVREELTFSFNFDFEYIKEENKLKQGVFNLSLRSESCEILTLSNPFESLHKVITEHASYATILECLLDDIQKSESQVGVLKIWLHGLIIFYDSLTPCMNENSWVEKLTKVKAFIFAGHKYVLSKMCHNMLEIAIQKFSTSVLNISHTQGISWDTDVSYLIFLMFSEWEKISLKMYEGVFENEDSRCLFDALMDVTAVLYSYHPLNTKEPLSLFDEYIKTLIIVIDSRFIGMNYAAETFSKSRDLLQREDVLFCLENNASFLINELQYLYLLLDTILEEPVLKNYRLYHVFLNSVKSIPLVHQQELLEIFFSKYGIIDTLKLPDFENQLIALLNQTVDIRLVEHQIVPLCLQSTKEVISKTVSQAVENAGQIHILIQILGSVPSACAFQCSPSSLQLLVCELQSYFSMKELSSLSLKNIVVFIQDLLQVIKEKAVISLTQLMSYCILPNLSCNTTFASMKLSLQVLYEICTQCLLHTNINYWMMDINVPAFIVCICQLINYFIITSKGYMKELAISVLDLLIKLDLQVNLNKSNERQDIANIWLWHHLSSMNPSITFYVLNFIPQLSPFAVKNIDKSLFSLPLLWNWCCLREKTPQLIKERIKSYDTVLQYPSLVTALVQNLPHFTVDEWRKSAILLKECLDVPSLRRGYFEGHNLSKKNQNALILTHIFVDVLLLLKNCGNIFLDWSYLISSLSKIIKENITNVDLSAKALALIFCEICRLAKSFEPEDVAHLSVPLLDISSEIKKCSTDAFENISISEFLMVVAKILPDCDTKSHMIVNLQELY